MSIHKHGANDDDSIDREQYRQMEYPSPDWTPKQMDNWESSMEQWYNELETDVGRFWAKATYRPKKRNDGSITRDHVKLGTPEDYVDEHVSDTFDPWGNLTSVMMRRISTYNVDKDELDEAISDIVRAKLRVLAENDPDRARQLVAETEKVASLYGIEAEQ